MNKTNLLTKLLLLCLLVVGSVNSWADTELYSTDFVNDWSTGTLVTNDATTLTTLTYPDELYVRASGSGKTISIVADKGLTFNSNLSVNNYIAGIKLSGINKSITITISHPYSDKKPQYRYYFVSGATSYSSSVSASYSTSTQPSTKGGNVVITISNITDANGVLYIGAASSSYYSLSSIAISTPDASGKDDPNLSVSPTSKTLAIDETQQLTASRDGDGAISYSSSNESVATVSNSGLITAKGNGIATITVTSAETDDYEEGTATVKVTVKGSDPTILQYAKFNNGLTNSPEGFVTIDGDINYHTNYTGTYDGTTFTKGLKMQSATVVNFSTASAGTLVVVQSTKTNGDKNIKIDDVAFATNYGNTYFYDDAANTVRIYICPLASGDHTIKRASDEMGLLYVGVTAAPAPSLSLSPSSASAFSYVEGNGPSAAQTFTVTGSNMTDDDITVSLNDGSSYYEISKDNTTYGTSDLTVASGDAVYVRLKSGLSIDSYAGTLRFSNEGADDVDIALSGSVTKQTWTITYNNGGGSGSMASNVVEDGDNRTLTTNTFTSDFYSFAGWVANVDVTINSATVTAGTLIADGATIQNVSSNITLTAQWTGNYASGSYTFENNDTQGTGLNSITLTNDNKNNAIAAGSRVDNIYFGAMSIAYESGTYSGEGDDFKGWKIKTNGATIKFLVEENKLVTIGVGNLTSGANITYTPAASNESTTVGLTAKTNNQYLAKAGTMVTITTTGGNTVTLKKILIEAAASASVSVGAKGYATYCNSDYALDFTDKSIMAYTINSTDGTSLTLTKKNKVAKGEPVLLYSETANDSQTIPAIGTSEASATDDNKLVEGSGKRLTWYDDTPFYVLYTGGTKPGFYKANNSLVNAGKAYLDLTGVSARAASFDLDLEGGETTGIANFEAKEINVKNGQFYNLNGQQVEAPVKGLYIVNGRKVIVK